MTNTFTKESPYLVVVFGLPGSGKSFFARKLAESLGTEYLNSDLLRKKWLPAGAYSQREKSMIYEKMLEEARNSIAQGHPVIMDATFFQKRYRENVLEKWGDLIPVFFIEIIADEELTRERLSHPRTDSDADYKIYLKIKNAWEPMTEPHLVLESRQDNIEDMLVKALSWLQIQHDKSAN